MVTVYPEEGRFPEIARALLAVADHPNQVVSVSHPRAGFLVPEEVFERFEATRSEVTEDLVGGIPQEIPRRRRPGRPRKTEPVVDPEKVEKDD